MFLAPQRQEPLARHLGLELAVELATPELALAQATLELVPVLIPELEPVPTPELEPVLTPELELDPVPMVELPLEQALPAEQAPERPMGLFSMRWLQPSRVCWTMLSVQNNF